jgi:hypothetical protein
MDEPGLLLPNAPDRWRCSQECSELDLTYLKRGIHDLYRRPLSYRETSSDITFIPIYQRGQIEAILSDYQALIHSRPTEEAIQKFMEGHPLIWAFLSPQRILHKPPVLTKWKADFAVLSTQRILYFVEIEKPQTKIATRTGNPHSQLQEGINQIRNWSIVVSDHRSSLLDELRLKAEDVHDIRYVLVAGLTQNTDASALCKLQRNPPIEKTLLYCYDELAAFLHNIASTLDRL